MPSAHRTAPTLETIPTEMKLMVASHLDPDVPLDLRWSQMAQHDAESRRASLRSLSLVSRSWAAALAGLKWQTLPVRAADLDCLLELARDWMPQHGPKVKSLVLLWWATADLSQFDDVSNFRRTLETAERFTGLTSSSAPLSERVSALQDALLATILRACSNLSDLKFLPQTVTSTRFFINNKGKILVVDADSTKLALQQIGGRITSADFLFWGATTRFYSAAVEALAWLPNLQHLRVGLEENSRDWWELIPAVSRLRRLLSLELDTPDIRPWLRRPELLPRNLTQCILSGTRHLDLQQLATILTSSPVVSLSLREFFLSDFQPRNYSPDNLRIEHLSIAGCTSPRLLNFFDAAPLKDVEFCANRRRTSPRINAERLNAFITKHRATLVSFNIDRALLAPSADVSAINRSLEQEGIAVRVVTVE
ncbi:hypothetical protein RHOSPDRAFT_35393 [Rhodotorula sp. JG-1b]|nr:hypothetical protein RHOSPDRAFT_35393 [Rhodotorula sp. JG-1b]